MFLHPVPLVRAEIALALDMLRTGMQMGFKIPLLVED